MVLESLDNAVMNMSVDHQVGSLKIETEQFKFETGTLNLFSKVTFAGHPGYRQPNMWTALTYWVVIILFITDYANFP